MISDALIRDLCTVNEIDCVLGEIGSRGRARTSILRPLLVEFLGSDRVESELEMRTFHWLNRNGIRGYVLQHGVFVPRKKRPYRLDFAWPGLKIGVEPEGYRVHAGSRDAFDNGHARRNAVVSMGWRLLHPTWYTQQGEFISELKALLAEAAAWITDV